jgi:hypothetical protein
MMPGSLGARDPGKGSAIFPYLGLGLKVRFVSKSKNQKFSGEVAFQ